MCLSNFKFNEDELKRAFPKYFKNMGFEGRGMQISLPANMDLRLFAETTVPEELVKKAWAKQTWTTAMKDLFFGKFMGEGVNNIIQVLNDLEKESGDRITQSLVLKLKGDGVTGDDILEGNEEKMEYRSFDFTINQLRNAVRLKGKFEEKKSKENMRNLTKARVSVIPVNTYAVRLVRPAQQSKTGGRKICVKMQKMDYLFGLEKELMMIYLKY
jgi:RNA recognition motif-containing protein